ncbi:MAG: hypothetical protein IH599_09300, partial [Bacteroidales bacterium]|nr:hypothetical protein [Bacteroidales bacterium]
MTPSRTSHFLALWAVCFLLVTAPAAGQISKGGEPLSWRYSDTPELRILSIEAPQAVQE